MSNDIPLPVDDRARDLVVASPEDGHLTHLALAGGSYSILVSGAQTDGRYTLIDMLVPPGGGPPPHRHDFEEAFTLLDGELEFTFRGQARRISAPATIAIPANAPHSFRNVADRSAHMLCMCTPAGQEEFFEGVGVRVPVRGAAPPSMSPEEATERRALAVGLAGRFRTEFLAS